jgi:hypothetical protein
VALLIGLILIVAVLSLYLYGTYVGARFVAKKTGSKAAAVLAFLILLFIPVSDDVIGRIQFSGLCKLEAGYVVSRIVETDGYLDGKALTGCDTSCKEALVNKGFRYVEINVRNPRPPVREAGIYRFSLAKGDSPSCAEHYWYVSHYRGGRRGSLAMANDQCLVGERSSEPASKYEYVLAQRRPVTPSPVRIERVSSHLKDRTTGEHIGNSTSFVLFGGGWLANYLSWHISGTSCPNDWKDSHGPIEAALRPRGN